MKPRGILVIVLLLLGIGGGAAAWWWSGSAGRRLAQIDAELERSDLRAHIDVYGRQAGAIVAVKQIIGALLKTQAVWSLAKKAGNPAALLKKLAGASAATALANLVSKSEVVAAATQTIDELGKYPARFKAALDRVRAQPSDETLSGLDAVARDGRKHLVRTRDFVARLAALGKHLDDGIRATAGQVPPCQGAPALVCGALRKGVEKLNETVKASLAEIRALRDQLDGDIDSLGTVLEIASVGPEP